CDLHPQRSLAGAVGAGRATAPGHCSSKGTDGFLQPSTAIDMSKRDAARTNRMELARCDAGPRSFSLKSVVTRESDEDLFNNSRGYSLDDVRGSTRWSRTRNGRVKRAKRTT